MRDLQSARIAQKNILEGGAAEIWLVEVYADASTVYRYAGFDQDVVFGGNTYTAHPLTVTVPDADLDGTEQDWAVTFGDAALVHAARLAAGKYVDQQITAILINRLTKTNSADKIPFRGLVYAYDLAEPNCTLVCGSYRLKDVQLPRETMERDRCNNEFADDLGRCGYVGADTSCAKSPAACAAKSKSARFRAAPGMMRMRP